MKTLNEILNESLLDADFDVSVEDVYADNIVNKIIEITSSHHLKNYNKTVKELYSLLKSAARGRQEQDTPAILQRLRAKDNTSIFMFEELGVAHLFIQKLVRGSRPHKRDIQLRKQDDGSSSVYMSLAHPVAPATFVPREMDETLVFLGPKVWNKLESFWASR